MFRSIRSFLGFGPKKQPVRKPSKFFKHARVKLEGLEDRTAPTVDLVPANNFNINPGGTLLFEISNATGEAGAVSGWDLVKLVPNAESPSVPPILNLSAISAD